jgi:hypothetical protein
MNFKTKVKEFGKQTLKNVHKLSTKLLVSRFDHGFLHDDIPISTDTYHTKHLIEFGNQKGKRVLEVGSREVTGKSAARKNFDKATYVGFDFYAGDNVDVVGDAHKLSTYFEEKFDVIYSSAVFEHLAMPWIASFEIAKCSHERPWHFFQFSDMALKVLFPPELGIECIEAGVSNSIVGRFSSRVEDVELANQNVTGLYCHSTFLGRKIQETSSDFDWKNLNLQDVVGDTLYPQPKF